MALLATAAEAQPADDNGTGKPVERGNVESSTVGNFAVQLAASEAASRPFTRDALHRWAERLSDPMRMAQAV